MEEDEQILRIAEKAGFKDFTQLQWKIFSDEDFFDCRKWLFVTGATGSGKTLIALVAYFFEQERRAKKNLSYKMLFAVPYRALASQKTMEIRNFSKALGLNLNICQSTSEYLADDAKIFNGKVDIAVIINEKIFMFACNDADFLRKYDLLVLDEIGLVKDEQRGIKTDFVLLHALRKNLRVIALGTPFYSWENYIRKFGFVNLKEDERPIKLLELPIVYDEEKICEVPEDCKAVSVQNFSECEFFNDKKLLLQQNKIPLLKIIALICKYHLQRNEKIFVFLNNRSDVRHLSHLLSRELIAKGILTLQMTELECKNKLCKKIQADNADIFCGIMNKSDYFAFACGITYHSADMFSALRTVIEEDFLSDSGSLKIIFSTETLAFGINSNADVVIIPEIEKYKYGARKRYLYPNEYMNYCGRAGRLKSSRAFDEQKKIGYVYPFICADKFKINREREAWIKLQSQIKSPERILSKFFDSGSNIDGLRPLYVLSLFSMFKDCKTGVSIKELEEILKILPGSAGISIGEELVEEALMELLKRNLIYEIEEDDEEEENISRRFSFSDVGKELAGHVISIENYDHILRAVCEYISNRNFFVTDMFYSVISSSEIISSAKSNFGDFKETDMEFIKLAVLQMKSIFVRFRDKTTMTLFNLLMYNVEKFNKFLTKNSFSKICKDKDFFICRNLAAVLMWYDSKNCSPVKMYNALKIYYASMHRMIELVSYRLEIIRIVLPLAPAKEIGSVLYQILPESRLNEVADKITAIIDKVMFFPSQELTDFLEIKRCDLFKAQRLREVEMLYKLLKSPDKHIADKKLFNSLVANMNSWEPSWREQFKKHFGGEIFCPTK